MDAPAELRVLGVRVHAVSMEDAVQRVGGAIEAGRSGAPPLQIATVNPEFVMRARRDKAFADVLQQAGLCLPDGIGTVWAARLAGVRLARVAGVDFVAAVARAGAVRGWRLFFLGAAPGVAEAAAGALQARYRDLVIAGTWAGGPAAAEEEENLRRIRTAQADVLFVAYGAPTQDLWIARHRARLSVPVAAGVGGAFDFLAGRRRRAPAWIRRIGLEWAHRLVQEPWRASRMLALPSFVVAVLRERTRAAATKPPPVV